ncbi:histone-lysine N-methyltransferase Smyd1 isoform X2 [Lepisosteus oculatus]|uniref:histone-lysine N-methyltransferase Smyd1 isoform X2 n=1 Tax=Lepisosteus oculatus TaxID=7918 RepID=UPI00371ABAC2
MESVEVFQSEGKGRGLRATRELWAGDVLFAEPSFAAVVFDSLTQHVCHTCFARQPKLQRCGQCKFAHYCDRTCQREGWAEHKGECSAIKKYGQTPNENIRLAARVLWRIEREGSSQAEGSLTSLDELEDHVADMPEEDRKELKIDVHNFLDYWPPHSRQFGVEYISHIFGVINCNGFTVSDQRGLQAVGVGLFPNLCLVNHDCWPNCSVILNNGKIELRALGKISPGEELTVSYVDFLSVGADRRRQLRQQYFFECSCEHCAKGIKDDLMMAVKEEEGKKPPEEVVKEVLEFSQKALEKIEKERSEGNYQEVVKLCRKCLEKQEPVLGDTHIYLLRILSVISEVLSYLQYFEDAAEYARRMVDGYLKLYHPNNAQLGMATMRAGVTHWHAGLIEVGHSMICKAYAILLVTHGPTHPITKDLEAMRMQTEMELRMFQQNEFVYYSMREAALKNQPMKMMAEPTQEALKMMFRRK